MPKNFLFIFLLFYLSAVLISAQDWKTYPYHQEGSRLFFPMDEGWHSNASMEWWYLNTHVTGTSTGNKYSIMVAYFYYPQILSDGIRIFNIANDTQDQFYSQTLPCDYSYLASDHLNIKALPFGSSEEEWATLQDSLGNLKPFEYQISAVSNFGSVKAKYNAIKRPLMIGGTGFLYQGTSGYSYYYSQTLLNLIGTLKLNDITEPITGTAWIDHQYGELKSTIEDQYEWFSVQLSNGMDLNIWTIFYGQNQSPNTSNYKICSIYLSDSKDTSISNFELTRLMYTIMPNSSFCYAQKWRFVWDNIDLIITTNQKHNEVLSPFRFYEGSTTINGIVNGVPVTGIGFAELLHRYKNPQIKFIKATGNITSSDTVKLTWELLNPDEGRPIYYDLEFSNNGGVTFKPIVQGLTTTSFDWDSSGSGAVDNTLIRVTGYSIDSTLRGNDIITIGSEKNYADIKSDFQLIQNYPNPFNPTTTLKFELPRASLVNLSVYNSLGQLVEVLVHGNYEVGVHEIVFDAFNLASGIYFSVLKVENNLLKQKMVLIK